MSCIFPLADGQLSLLVDGVEEKSRPIDATSTAVFKGWATRYERCVRDDKRERSGCWRLPERTSRHPRLFGEARPGYRKLGRVQDADPMNALPAQRPAPGEV